MIAAAAAAAAALTFFSIIVVAVAVAVVDGDYSSDRAVVFRLFVPMPLFEPNPHVDTDSCSI